MTRRQLFSCLLGLIMMMNAHANAILTGAGASFPYPLYVKWAQAYYRATGIQVNYQSIGSGGGQQQIIAGTVDFGATDDPMATTRLQQHHLFQFPSIVGGIVPVVHLDGIGDQQLVLSGPVLASIFMGKIKRWDDPQITALNPHLSLPHRAIIVIYRSDGSGTTFAFSNYLAQVSPTWKKEMGVGKALNWPTGQGGKGNEGVSAYVKVIRHAITYVESSYATHNHLAQVKLINTAGQVVAPSIQTFQAAAQNANWDVPGMAVNLSNAPGAQSWPITVASFVVLDPQRAVSHNAFQFFQWAWHHGQQQAMDLDYVPLPDNVVQRIEQKWKK